MKPTKKQLREQRRKALLNNDKVYTTSQEGIGNSMFLFFVLWMLFGFGHTGGFGTDYGNKTK